MGGKVVERQRPTAGRRTRERGKRIEAVQGDHITWFRINDSRHAVVCTVKGVKLAR
jgi:hypothetical protein